MHGGTIGVGVLPGRGTVLIRRRFPVLDAVPAYDMQPAELSRPQAREPEAEEGVRESFQRVLIVDDNPDIDLPARRFLSVNSSY